MPSLKILRVRIKSVKSTQKITKAMKMVAAAKLRRAKEHAETARPYAEGLENILQALASGSDGSNAPALLTGNGKNDTHLLLVATADRGLCGAFNGSIVRASRRKIIELRNQGKQVKLFCVGRKGYEQLHREYGSLMVGHVNDISKRRPRFEDAQNIAIKLVSMFEAGEFDVASIVYNKFKSAISQEVTFQQLIPLVSSHELAAASASTATSPYEYEPSEEAILTTLLPRNLATQIYKAFLENSASEQGARMTAMDNATRNAGEMIKKLTLNYNRSRQAAITKELIEIISGAEAV